MTKQPARHGRLNAPDVAGELDRAADVVQDSARRDEVAIDRRLQVLVVPGVLVHEVQTRVRHRQRVLEQTACVRKKMPQCRRCILERIGALPQNRQHQPPQRHIGDLRLGEAIQLQIHRLNVVARPLHKFERIKAVGLVVFGRVADVVDVDLRAIRRMLVVGAAHLVELAFLPLAFTGFVPRAVAPHHETGGAPGVAEAAREVGFAVAASPFGALGQEHEEIAGLTGGHFIKPNERRLGFGHRRDFPLVSGTDIMRAKARSCQQKCPDEEYNAKMTTYEPITFRHVLEAAAFAARKHQHHFRKDDKTPYVSHVFRVCLIVRDLFGFNDPRMLCTALLHDTVEDTTTDFDDVAERFSPEIAHWVALLSKDKRLPESEREAAYVKGLQSAPWQVQACKLADVYDNLSDLIHLPADRRGQSLKRTKQYLDALAAAAPVELKRPLELACQLWKERSSE